MFSLSSIFHKNILCNVFPLCASVILVWGKSGFFCFPLLLWGFLRFLRIIILGLHQYKYQLYQYSGGRWSVVSSTEKEISVSIWAEWEWKWAGECMPWVWEWWASRSGWKCLHHSAGTQRTAFWKPFITMAGMQSFLFPNCAWDSCSQASFYAAVQLLCFSPFNVSQMYIWITTDLWLCYRHLA